MDEIFKLTGMMVSIVICVALIASLIEIANEKIKNRKVICEHCNKKHSKKHSINVKGFYYCNEKCLIDYCKKL